MTWLLDRLENAVFAAAAWLGRWLADTPESDEPGEWEIRQGYWHI